MSNTSWTLRMAWRDSRGHKKKFLIILLSIAIGVSALTALDAFNKNISSTLKGQSRDLLGADLVLSSRKPIDDKVYEELTRQNLTWNLERRLASMALFPSGESRLIQLRAFESTYPFYGEIKSKPAQLDIHKGDEPYCLIEEGLAIQFGLKIGDKVRLGKTHFAIKGILQELPGETAFFSTIAPRVVISAKDLQDTGLIRFGSRVFNRINIKYAENTNEKQLLNELKPITSEQGLRTMTVFQRQEAMGEIIDRLFTFFSFIALTALVIGGIGVANATKIHIQSKLQNAAILNCLGCDRSSILKIFLAQSFFIGLFGGIVGAILGFAIQQALPSFLSSFLPTQVEVSIEYFSLLKGFIIGPFITVLFSLPPLLSLFKLPPLPSVKAADEDKESFRYRFITISVTTTLLFTFSLLIATDKKSGLYFATGILVCFALLTLLTWVLRKVLKALPINSLPFTLRQGFKSLLRPDNHSASLITVIGGALFFILTVSLVKDSLIRFISSRADGPQANMILFDIQPDQKDGILKELEKEQMPNLLDVPIVSLKLMSIKGVDVKTLRLEKPVPGKASPNKRFLNRAYRCTYRSELQENTETIIRGEFICEVEPDAEVIPISIEESLTYRLGVDLGDEIEFELFGIPLTCKVTSIRKVNWLSMSPNFFVVFPKGVLDDAPQMQVLVTRFNKQAQSLRFQKSVTTMYPNVSLIDISLIMNTTEKTLGSISKALQTISAFTVLAAVIILLNSLTLTYQQRQREAALLKTLGASPSQLRNSFLAEFILLGFFSAGLSAAMAQVASTMLCQKIFNITPSINYGLLATTIFATVFAVSFTGWLFCRRLYKQTTLEILREEN